MTYNDFIAKQRSNYINSLDYILEQKDYEKLPASQQLDVISIVRACNKLENRFNS